MKKQKKHKRKKRQQQRRLTKNETWKAIETQKEKQEQQTA